MPFIIEISGHSSNKSRYMQTSAEQFSISADRCGILNLDTVSKQSAFIYCKTQTDGSFTAHLNEDSRLDRRRFNGGNLISFKTDQYNFRIYKISQQADLLARLNKPELINKKYYYLLECPEVNYKAGIYADQVISVGSSEFDAVMIALKDLKARHFEIYIDPELRKPELIPRTGLIKNKREINNTIHFSAANLEFSITRL